MGSQTLAPKRPLPLVALCLGLGFTGLILFAYWPTLHEVVRRWNEPQYSHCYLVPIFACFLLWWRWDIFARAWEEATRLKASAGQNLRPEEARARAAIEPCVWWGGLLLAAGLALRYVGATYYYDALDMLSLLPLLAGACLLVGGVAAWKWAWPAVGFLVFMLPLPYRLEVAFAVPLRHLATVVSTYALQTLGLPAFSEGNVIIINDMPIGVAEACSGLSMLVTFVALCCGVALLSAREHRLDRVLIVLSAAPLAVAANILRIILTGLLLVTAGDEAAQVFYHTLAGWVMMPLALGLLYLGLKVLDHLLVKVEDARPVPLGRGARPGAGSPPRTESVAGAR